jgi:hypothetical protein
MSWGFLFLFTMQCFLCNWSTSMLCPHASCSHPTHACLTLVHEAMKQRKSRLLHQGFTQTTGSHKCASWSLQANSTSLLAQGKALQPLWCLVVSDAKNNTQANIMSQCTKHRVFRVLKLRLLNWTLSALGNWMCYCPAFCTMIQMASYRV